MKNFFMYFREGKKLIVTYLFKNIELKKIYLSIYRESDPLDLVKVSNERQKDSRQINLDTFTVERECTSVRSRQYRQ